MIGKKPEKPLAALLGRGATFGGDLTFEGRVRVDGTFKGRIHTDDTLEIGEGGLIEGEIDVATLIVSGTASGKIRARTLHLEPTGVLRGEVDADTLESQAGGRIDAVVRIGR